MQNISYKHKENQSEGVWMTFVGASQVLGARPSLSVGDSGSQNFLSTFLIVLSHETGSEMTNASRIYMYLYMLLIVFVKIAKYLSKF